MIDNCAVITLMIDNCAVITLMIDNCTVITLMTDNCAEITLMIDNCAVITLMIDNCAVITLMMFYWKKHKLKYFNLTVILTEGNEFERMVLDNLLEKHLNCLRCFHFFFVISVHTNLEHSR